MSLRATLLLVTVLCILLAWIAKDVQRPYYRGRLISIVEGAGGKVVQDEAYWDKVWREGPSSFIYWIKTFWNRRLTIPISEVNLSGSDVTDDQMQTVAALIRALSETESLELADTAVGDRTVAALEGCRLNKLNLSQTRITPASAASLARIQKLTMLWLDATKVGDETFIALTEQPDLARLSLEATRVSDAGLVAVGECKLRWLSVSGNEVTDRGVLALQQRNRKLHVCVEGTNLWPLADVANVTSFQLVGLFFDDSSLERLNHMPHLTDLTLNCPRITGAGLAQLKQRDQIWSLDLSRSGADDSIPAALEGWQYLHSLALAETKVTDAGLAHLARLPRLSSLDLSKTAITDAGLVHLSHAEQLHSLDLSGTHIDGTGLHNLEGMSNLRVLNLSGTAITDESLQNLPPLPKLEFLYLDRTAVTPPGIHLLRQLPERCSVICGTLLMTVKPKATPCE